MRSINKNYFDGYVLGLTSVFGTSRNGSFRSCTQEEKSGEDEACRTQKPANIPAQRC
jgi:hypothetical protein